MGGLEDPEFSEEEMNAALGNLPAAPALALPSASPVAFAIGRER